MPKKISSGRKKSTHQEQRDLDLEIGFIEGVVRRDPCYVEALQVLGDAYTKRGSYAEGLLIDERLAQLRPEDALVHYNLACSYSLVARCDQAAQSLEKAITLGYRDFSWMVRDTDLKNLRQTAQYKKIRARLREFKAQD